MSPLSVIRGVAGIATVMSPLSVIRGVACIVTAMSPLSVIRGVACIVTAMSPLCYPRCGRYRDSDVTSLLSVVWPVS